MAKAKTTATISAAPGVIQDAFIAAPMRVAGLHQPLECPNTGAPVAFHTLRMYQVDIVAKTTVATLSGFVSADAHAAGRLAVTHTSVNIPGMPEGDVAAWVYAQILAAGNADGTNAMFGCTPVLEAA